MNKLAMINSFEIILEKEKYFFFAKNHCEIQVSTILACTLYSIKYSNLQRRPTKLECLSMARLFSLIYYFKKSGVPESYFSVLTHKN
jgi:hypothetical protein